MTITVIAEAGVNHNGDLGRARDMIAAAAAAGADIVKFQAFTAEKLVAKGTATAAYQASNTSEHDQISLLKKLELHTDDFTTLARSCLDYKIEFLCTAFDVEMLAHLIDSGMRRIKIPSGELTNHPMLRRAASFGLPILLSTGMGTLDEVKSAVAVACEAGATDVTVLHCTSAYPAPDEVLNLRAMTTMRETLQIPVGYSDHSMGDHIAVAAVALGAVVIEKHFTLDRSLPGPDHSASLEPDVLKAMIGKLRATELALGDGIKRPAPGEMETATLVRRSWHALRELAGGTIITADDIVLKRPATGLDPGFELIGRRLARAVGADEAIGDADLV